MNMHANQQPTPASHHGADPAVDSVIARALAKDREQRFATAGALSRALAAAIGDPAARGGGASAQTVTAGDPAARDAGVTPAAGEPDRDVEWSPRAARGRWLGALVAAGALAAGAITIAVSARGSGGATASPPHTTLPTTSPAVGTAVNAGAADADVPGMTPSSAVDAGHSARTDVRRTPPAIPPDARRATPPDARQTTTSRPDARPTTMPAPDGRQTTTPDARQPPADRTDPPKPGDRTQWGDTVKPF
jgi:hypothetical protein